jgi:YggT family protein
MELIYILFRIYEIIILARVIISWIQVDHYHPVVVWIYRLTEPVLRPIRAVIPFERIGIDFSPLIVLLLIEVIKQLLMQSFFY